MNDVTVSNEPPAYTLLPPPAYTLLPPPACTPLPPPAYTLHPARASEPTLLYDGSENSAAVTEACVLVVDDSGYGADRVPADMGMGTLRSNHNECERCKKRKKCKKREKEIKALSVDIPLTPSRPEAVYEILGLFLPRPTIRPKSHPRPSGWRLLEDGNQILVNFGAGFGSLEEYVNSDGLREVMERDQTRSERPKKAKACKGRENLCNRKIEMNC